MAKSKAKKRWKAAAATAASAWIKQRARDLDVESFTFLAISIIEGAPITDKLPKGAKTIIKKRLANMYGVHLGYEQEPEGELPKIQRISQQEAANVD